MTNRQDTGPDHLSVWAINLAWRGGLDCMMYNSDVFFQRLRQFSYRPDIILVSEMPYCRRSRCDQDACLEDPGAVSSHQTFIQRLEASPLDAEYSYVHGEGPPEEAPISDHLVVFRKDRFTVVDEDVMVWQEVADDLCGANNELGVPNESEGRWQVAVRLWDALQSRYVVAVGLHLDHAYECVRENVLRMQEVLDGRWNPAEGARRDMIIVGGDFNEPPDTNSRESRARTEHDPDPWYRTMSESYGGELKNHDTVWTKHYVNGQGGNNPICSQWTRGNGTIFDEQAASQCDYDCEDDGIGMTELDCKAHYRIDFLWVRWETAAGDVVTAGNTPGFDPEEWIETAMADQGYFGSSLKAPGLGPYSDHRAVHAVLRWW